MNSIENLVLLQTDPEAGPAIAERQEEARKALQEANIPFEEQYVVNDWEGGASTPMLQTATGLHTGLSMIRAYAQSAAFHRALSQNIVHQKR